MNAKNILNADWLDILFEGRNKMYGAYNLRKYYSQKLQLALLITFLAVALVMLLIHFSGKRSLAIVQLPKVVDPRWAVIPTDKIIQPKPVQNSKAASSSSARDRYSKPVIIHRNSTRADKITTLRDDAAISSTTHQGANKPIVNIPTEILPSAVNSAIVQPGPTPVTVFDKVEVEASFPGGMKAWKRYLEKNLDPEKPLSAGAPRGIYVVVVKFIVGSDGKIRDARAETAHGFGMEEEALKVIRRGPSWVAAQQNDNSVDAWHSQSITFVVADE